MKAPSEITLYIAGAMAKYKDSGYNYSEFNKASTMLRKAGFNVLSPTEHGEKYLDSKPREWFMRLNLKKLLDADAIALLEPDFYEAEGCIRELTIASWCNFDKPRTVQQWMSYAVSYKLSQDKDAKQRLLD
jgi:hypothetical protein